MSLRRWWAVGVLLCALPLAARAQPAVPTEQPRPLTAVAGRVTAVAGRVTNGTALAAVPANLSVTLAVVSPSEALEFTTIAADGAFSFDAVPLWSNAVYTAAAAYRGRVFTSAPARVDPADAALDLPLTLYELTEDPAVVTLVEKRATIHVLDGQMEIEQVYRFRISGDRAYTTSQPVGERFVSLALELPPGAQILTFDTPGRYVAGRNFDFVDTAPALPGEHLILVTYLLAYDGMGAVIEQPVNYAFDGEMNLRVWPPDVSVSGEALAAVGDETLNDRSYRRYTAVLKRPPGGLLRYEITGGGTADTVTAAAAPANPLPLLLGLMIGGAVVVAVILLARSQTGKRS